MDTLDFIVNRYGLQANLQDPLPIPIRNVRRYDLGPLFRDLGFTQGAEVGVWKARFTSSLLDAHPGLHMFCVDPWVPYPEYFDHKLHRSIEGAYDMAVARLAQYGDRATIIRKFSVDAAKDIPDGSLDFVYIDGNHSYLDVVNDLEAWSKKVRVGGIISGHDYKDFTKDDFIHVVEAVHGFVGAHYIRPWFVLGRARARRGEATETPRSFMWVKLNPKVPIQEWPRPYTLERVK